VAPGALILFFLLSLRPLVSRRELNPLFGLTKPAANEVKHAPKSGEPFLIRRGMGLWLLSAWLFSWKNVACPCQQRN
jgi:hypothetical protein